MYACVYACVCKLIPSKSEMESCDIEALSIEATKNNGKVPMKDPKIKTSMNALYSSITHISINCSSSRQHKCPSFSSNARKARLSQQRKIGTND